MAAPPARVRLATAAPRPRSRTALRAAGAKSAAWRPWPEVQTELREKLGVKPMEPDAMVAACAAGKAVMVDVRPPNEYEEWHAPGSVNLASAKPRKNLLKRSIGYFIGVKGGLKEENEEFEEEAADRLPDKRATIVTVCMKGGSLEPSGLSTSIDPTDSPSLRVAYRLKLLGYRDVRYCVGGLPLAIEEGDMDFSEGQWGATLTRAKDVGALADGVRLAMYSRMLPDPSTAPGFVGQAVVFAAVGLYFKNDDFHAWADGVLTSLGWI